MLLHNPNHNHNHYDHQNHHNTSGRVNYQLLRKWIFLNSKKVLIERRTRNPSQLQRLIRGRSGPSRGGSPDEPDQRVGGGQDGAQDCQAAAGQGLDSGPRLAVLHLDGQLPRGRVVGGPARLGGRALG